MSIYAGIEIYGLDDIFITTDLGKNIVLNGVVFNGTGIGIKWDKTRDRLTTVARTFYSTKDVLIRTDKNKKVSINGTDYPSTTGIARVFSEVSELYVNGLNWYGTQNIVINVAPGKKVIINDVEITGTPDVPSTATVGSLSPNTLITSSGTLVTVNGTGFTPSTVIYENSNSVQTTYVSATSLTSTYFGTVGSVQTIPVGVKKPGELLSNTVNFSVTAPSPPPAPNISSLSPSTLVTSSGTLVTVTGTNFVSGCVIKADGVGVQTTFVSATSLTTTYLGTVSSVSTVAITVQNPDTQTSNSVNFSVTAPAPSFDNTALAGWWDAADAAVFTYGTGTQIASWIDKSTKGWTVSRSPIANLSRTGTINGVPCVTCTHNSVTITRASVDVQQMVDVTNKTDCMSFVVYSSIETDRGFLCNLGASNRVSYQLTLDGGTSYVDIGGVPAGRLGTVTSGFVIGDVPQLIAAYRSGANIKLFANGVEKASKTDATGSVSASDVSTLQVGAFNGSANVGRIGEIIHVARYNATQFTDIQSYLGTKWGISLPTIPTSELKARYDASDAASFTYSSGNVVSQWNDISGSGFHVSQGTVGLQPTRSGTQNGKSTVVFNGQKLKRSLGSLQIGINGPTGVTYIVVCKRVGAAVSYCEIPVGLSVGNGGCPLIGWGVQRYTSIYGQSGFIDIATGLTSWSIFTLSAKTDGAVVATTITEWVNGIQTRTSTANYNWNPQNYQTIGIASRDDGATQFDGEIAEILMYNKYLSDVERQQAEAFLKTKWGTP